MDLSDRYEITSNRESGYGRYDVMLKPRKFGENPAIIMEFKVHDPEREKDLKETVKEALVQIREKQYAATLSKKKQEDIMEYGFAFEGKKVLVDGGSISEVERILNEG